MSIFKACDIRGIVGSEWDAADAARIGRSLGSMLCRRGERWIYLGGDFRRTTPALKHAVARGLVEAGVTVYDLGQVPTPVVYFAARSSGCGNVAVVTASHNPGPYNGIKFMVAGRPAVPALMDELREGLDTNRWAGARGTVEAREALPSYERWVADHAGDVAQVPARDDRRLEEPLAPGRRARVVLDAMQGAFTYIAPRVLEARGASVVSRSKELDPDFAAGPPNPAEDAHLAPLIDHLQHEPADLGVALDGDGDRVIFVSEGGAIARPEQIAALLIRHGPPRPTVVYDLKCASIVPRAVAAAGGIGLMRPSGHGFIKTAMIERHADLGVEVSGHHFFAALDGGDDGLFTALVLLDLMGKSGQPLGDLLGPVGWPAITPDLRVPYRGDAAAVVEQIAAACGGHVSRLDGVRAEYEDGWGLARASITEPAITFRFEGRDRAGVRAIASRFLAGAPELSARVLEMMGE